MLLIIAALISYVPNGDTVQSYISFAAAVASIVLAVIAIFYSMISNSSLLSSISSLRGLDGELEQQAKNLESISEGLNEKIVSLSDKIESIPTQIEKMDKSLHKRMNEISISDKVDSDSSLSAQSSKYISGKMTVGLGISIYLIAMAAKKGKPFKIDDVFDGSKIVSKYVEGCLAALSAIKYKGLKLESEKGIYNIGSVGQLEIDKILENSSKRKHKVWVFAVEKITKYFSEDDEKEESEEEDSQPE